MGFPKIKTDKTEFQNIKSENFGKNKTEFGKK